MRSGKHFEQFDREKKKRGKKKTRGVFFYLKPNFMFQRHGFESFGDGIGSWLSEIVTKED